jgi:hypothetical protein
VLGGLALDGVVAICLMGLAAVAVHSWAGTAVGRSISATLASLLSPLTLSSGLSATHLSWAAFAAQASLLAAILLFTCQLASVSFFRSTLGRFVVGVELAPPHGRLHGAVGMAMAEVLSLGGILSLPFVLLTPNRVPIFSWLKLRAEA